MPRDDDLTPDEVSERAAARDRVKGWFDKPDHKRPKGHPDDLATRDDDIADPAKQEED